MTAGEATELQFAVRDTGIGLSPEGMSRLFQSSARPTPPPRASTAAPARPGDQPRLAELMGGTMWAESDGTGQGSTFRFTIGAPEVAAAEHVPLPAAEARRLDPTMAAAPPAAHPARRGQRREPEAALRLLQQMGYRADLASNGIEAIESIERQPYDVVLMDVQMPEMDGLEASRRITAQVAAGRAPAHRRDDRQRDAGDREECLAAGMDDYVTKPIRVDALVEALLQVRPA